MTVENSGPYDLNIPVACAPSTTLRAVVVRALGLGYHTLALNTEVKQSMFVTRKEKKARLDTPTLEDFPPPPTLDLQPQDYPLLAARGLKPNILTRLTITVSNNEFMIRYNKSSTARQYDILSLNCASAQALTAIVKSNWKFDILTFDPNFEAGMGIKWSRKLYYECVDKNIHFELSYSPMIRDSMDRRRVISQAHMYHSVGKSRSIILTSEARKPLELRAPGDVANLAFLLGLSENQGKTGIGENGFKVHKAAVGRRMGPFRARIDKLTSDNEHLVPANTELVGSENTAVTEEEE